MNRSQQQKSEVRVLSKLEQGVRVDIDQTSIIIPPKHGSTSILNAVMYQYDHVDDILKNLHENVIWVYRPLKDILYSAHVMIADNILTYKLVEEGVNKSKYDDMLNMDMNVSFILQEVWGHHNNGYPLDYHLRQDLRYTIPDIWEDHWEVKRLKDIDFPWELERKNKQKTTLKPTTDALFPIEHFLHTDSAWYLNHAKVEHFLSTKLKNSLYIL